MWPKKSMFWKSRKIQTRRQSKNHANKNKFSIFQNYSKVSAENFTKWTLMLAGGLCKDHLVLIWYILTFFDFTANRLERYHPTAWEVKLDFVALFWKILKKAKPWDSGLKRPMGLAMVFEAQNFVKFSAKSHLRVLIFCIVEP